MTHVHLHHSIEPVFDVHSRILILGSFPSVQSRASQFFYGHPQNRFWRVFSAVYDSPLPQTVEEKKQFLHSVHIALWDVIGACEIVGSSDSSIKNVVPNDLKTVLDVADIKQIFVNGKTAEKYYDRYIKKTVNREAICLPSTSPANASWSIARLIDAWRVIRCDG